MSIADLDDRLDKVETVVGQVRDRLGSVESRIAVNESKTDMHSHQLTVLHGEVSKVRSHLLDVQAELRKSGETILDLLRGHIDKENERRVSESIDRAKLLRGALAATLGVVASVLGWAALLVADQVFPGLLP